MALSRRRYGVEIECGHPGGVDAVSALLRKEKIQPLSIGRDGSGVEVRSPVLQGAKGFEWLRECMQAIREDGGYVTTSDGMHVHHSGSPGYKLPRGGALNTVNILRLIHSWKNNNDLICKLVSERRRTNTSYCAKVWKDARTVKSAESGSYPGKYSDLNLRSLQSSKGTVEIRLHEGTLDADECEAWVRFGQSILDAAAKSDTPLPKQKSVEALLDLLIDQEDAKKCLVEKAKRNGEPLPTSGYRDTHPDRFDDDDDPF